MSNYVKNQQRFISVSTVVIPLTSCIPALMDCINYETLGSLYHRIYLSNLRMESSVVSRSKLVRSVAIFYNSL